MLRERKGDDEERTEKRMNPVLQGGERRENEEEREGESNATEREEERITREEEREERRHSCRHVSSLSFSNKGAVPSSRPVAVNRETKNFCGI